MKEMYEVMELRRRLAEVFKTLEDEGFVFPVIMTSIHPNGSVQVTRFWRTEGGKLVSDDLTSHTATDGPAVPVNIVFVDQRGETYLTVLETTRTSVDPLPN